MGIVIALPAPIGPIPELECTPAQAGRVGRQLRTLARAVKGVQGWAEKRSADGAGWTGDAAEASDHTSTRFARRLAAPEAALFDAAAASDTFQTELTTLNTDRAQLNRDRVALSEDIETTANTPVASILDVSALEAEAEALRTRATDLRSAIDAWAVRVATAESDYIAALQKVDTVAEGVKIADRLRVASDMTAGVRRTVNNLIAEGVLPAETRGMSAEQLREYLIDHPEVAEALTLNPPEDGARGAEGVLAGVSGSREDARGLFDSMRPADAALLAMLFPRQVGAMSGVPFETRADANMVNVIAELNRERELPDRMAGPLEGEAREDWERRMALYQSIIEDDRQMILFDPVNDRIAELHGTLGPDVKNIGVHVPGTGSSLDGYQDIADRSNSFVDYSKPGALAMITWLGGGFPPDLADAASSDYADELGPRLADFSHDVRQEADHAGADEAKTTYMGHSYGGAVVGTSETHGLDADRVLHVESAGMGDGVDRRDDLPDSQRSVDRYSMTDDDDFIRFVQGIAGGHGADPDEFPGTTRLETGNYTDGEEISGPFASHSGVYEPMSDSWENMRQVLNGGTVTTADHTETYWQRPHVGGVVLPGFPYRTERHHPSEEIDIE